MKKPYSKYMDAKTVGILEKSIKASEVQRTIEMIDTLILFYHENGLDIDEEDDSDGDISYGNERETHNENNKNMNGKIIDYMLAGGNNILDLQEDVKIWIGEGWQPIGGVCYQAESHFSEGLLYMSYYQAMVKYSNK